MSATDQFVRADEFNELKRKYSQLREQHAHLQRVSGDVQRKSYEEGRADARREYLRDGSKLVPGDKIAHLELPGNGGAIQFHPIGVMGPRPLTGGALSPDADFMLRIWGPPDDSGSYGVHGQGGGNLTDFSMHFDLTDAGIVIHRMDITGVRSRWDRSDSPASPRKEQN